jgi:hypothetical protein
MTLITIDAGTLTASADERTVTGLLVPYGEECRSNLGKFTVEAGAFEIPEDLQGVTFNREHTREDVLGAATSVRETAEGIVATFSVARTAAGDAALADIAAGTRKHLSAEVANVLIKAGRAVGGRLFAGALVATPAFPSATLLAAAPDTEEAERIEILRALIEEASAHLAALESAPAPEIAEAPEVEEDTTPETPEPAEAEEAEEERKKKSLMATASVPNTLAASGVTTEPRPLSVHEVGTLYAKRSQGLISDLEMSTALEGQNGNTLFGALSDVKYNGTGGLANAMSPTPQWLGQVWQATTYRQQVLPLFTHGNLNALTFAGFKWGTKPAGGDWAGNKADVPSNTLTVSPVSGTALRYAVGHDIAREFVDFPVEGFFESYAAAVTEDYARWADGKVAAAVIGGATALAGDALTTLPGATGGTIGSAASAIIDGATAIITTGALPDFALVSTNLWKQLVKMPQNNVIGYLNAALGLSEGDLAGFTIRPSASVAAGKVLVGAKSAVTVLELPGAPIRIDALDLARGGVDKAAFGYLGVNVNDALGLQLVTAATA